MKKHLLISILTTIILLVIVSFLTNKHLTTFLSVGIPSIDDYKIFANDTVKAKNYIEWKLTNDYNKKVISDSLKKQIENYETVAFLVIQNGKIKYEEYWNGYDKDSIVNSFSVSKSIISLLVGIAIDEKAIEGLDQKITDILPNFNRGKPTDLTIRNLLSMSSGSDWNEQFRSPFSDVLKAYFGNNLDEMYENIHLSKEIGKKWEYQCGNTLILMKIIEKTTNSSITEYAQRNLWTPIGAKNSALWSIDKENGTVKAFCCFHATCRDFARLGQVVLDKGEFDRSFVVPRNYINQAITPADYLTDKNNEKVDFYGLHFWIAYHKGLQIPYMRGMHGQYIFILQEKNAVVVRLGKKRTEEKIKHTPIDAFIYLDAAMEILD